MSSIVITNTDPGEGQPLAADTYMAVYGGVSILDLFYPVGCYFETSDTSFDPNTVWGGVWEEDTSGKVLVSYQSGDSDFGTVGGTGGRKETRHVSFMTPLNSGRFQDPGTEYYTSVVSDMNTYLTGGGSSSLSRYNNVRAKGGSVRTQGTENTEVSYLGYTAPNLQPYKVVKRWHRIQ